MPLGLVGKRTCFPSSIGVNLLKKNVLEAMAEDDVVAFDKQKIAISCMCVYAVATVGKRSIVRDDDVGPL